MVSDPFFNEAKEQSLVKATIIAKYFRAWSRVIIPTAKKWQNKIAYIDLFAGPGRYKDGTLSVPLLILETAIADEDLRNMLVTVFNDKDDENTKSLESEVNALSGVESLRYEPQIVNHEVGEEIVKLFEQMALVPTLFFVDPWGYKGLSLRLINSVLKDWGCDCIIFFNYNRISMGLSNEIVKEHIDALFGEERANSLRVRIDETIPAERESLIIQEIVNALKEMGGKLVLPFRFKDKNGSRTSHHLIFISKNFRGYEIMKDIMARESTRADQGVPSLEYSPSDRKFPTLFELSRPLDALESSLLTKFAGRTLSMKQVYEEHNIDTPYIKKNYKDVLRKMEEVNLIAADPPANKRRKLKGDVTFADGVFVTFPQ